MKSFFTLLLGLILLLGGCTGEPTESSIPTNIERQENLSWAMGSDMGPPPFEYIRIRGEAVPDWKPVHLRQKRAGAGAGFLNWEPLGPRPIVSEYWSGDDDASGRVVSIAPHPSNADIVYIASASGGVWKTIDGGLNWTPLTDELSNLNHGAVALDPSNPDTVYVGTGEYTTGSNGDGLFRSLDGGATWNKIATTGQTSTRFTGIIVDPTNPLIIHCSGSGGYDRSDDGGATWTQYHSGGMSSMGMSPNDSDVLYLGDHSDGIRQSVDGGDTWTMLTGGLPTSGISRIVLAVSPTVSVLDTVYAAFVTGSGLEGFYKTTDSGVTWTKLVNTPDFPSPQAWYDLFVGVDPSDPDIVYCGGVFPSYAVAGVIKTIDGGVSWNDITVSSISGQLHPDQHAVAWGPDGTLWIGNDGGVWKSNDAGDSWINTNATLTVTQNYAIALNPLQPDIMMGGTQDNGTIERQSDIDDWPQIRAGDGGYLVYDFDFPTRRYTTYVRLSIARQTGGASVNITGPWSGDPKNFIAPMVMDPNDAHTLLGGTDRIWRTNNAHDAADWTAISTNAVGGGSTINAIAVATGASDTIYCGNRVGQVYITTDATTWNLRSTGLPSGQIADIMIDPVDPSHAFVSFHNTSGARILETIDQGLNWTNVTGNLPSGISARALEVDWRFNTPGLYIGSGVGVYSSSDGGFTWIKDGTDLPNVNIGDLLIDEPRGMIYAGTYGRGTWKSPLPPSLANLNCPADRAGPSGPDNMVNVTDLLALLGAWGTAGGPDGLCDFAPWPNTDGIVNVTDLLALLSAWGVCPPAGDDLADARAVGDGSYQFDTTFANTDGLGDCANLQSDIWYCYTATCTGDTTFSLCGSSYDTVMAIYDGCDGAGGLLACDDDSCGSASEITIPTIFGQSYLVRIGGHLGDQGTGTLSIDCANNDQCANAIPILAGDTAYSTIGATTDGPANAACETGSDGGQTFNDIWYTWTAPNHGTVTVSTCGQADYDTDLVIYSNTDCSNLLFIACDDDYALDPCGGNPTWHSQIDDVAVTSGQTYLIRVGGWGSGSSGTGTLSVIFTSSGPFEGPAPASSSGKSKGKMKESLRERS